MVVRYKGTFDAGKSMRKPTELSFRRKDHERYPFPVPKLQSRSANGLGSRRKKSPPPPRLDSETEMN